MSEWANSGRSFATRTSDLSNGVAGSDGNVYKLDPGTVFDDRVIDSLFRGTGGSDWFFVGSNDHRNPRSSAKVTILS